MNHWLSDHQTQNEGASPRTAPSSILGLGALELAESVGTA